MSELKSVYVLTGGFDVGNDDVMGAFDELDSAIEAMEKDAKSSTSRGRYHIYRCIIGSREEPTVVAWKRTRP